MIRSSKQGFTLVELTFVMAFLAILLLSILAITLQIGKVYTKGVTNRDMNQLTRDLTDSIRRDVSSVDPGSFRPKDSSGEFKDYVQMGSGDAKSGRLCLGSVTYVWNTAALLNSGSVTMMRRGSDKVTFMRVLDTGSTLCVKKADGTYAMTIPSTLTGTPLLNTGGRTIAVYDLSFEELARSGGEALYKMRLTIGTNDEGVTTQSATGDVSTTQCRPPTDNSANFDYCSVVTLDMLIRAGGSSS